MNRNNESENQDPTEAVVSTLRQIIRATDLQSKQLTKKYGLTGPQLILLKEIYKAPEKQISEIAQKVCLSQATVTSILDRLEQQGFAERHRSEIDKRRVYIRLSPKAEDILKSNPSLLKEEFTDRFSKLADWEKNMILSSLQRLASMMNDKDVQLPPLLASE